MFLFFLFLSNLFGSTISLHPGEIYSINDKEISKIVITDSKVVRAKQVNGKINFLAKSTGVSQVKIIKTNSTELLTIKVKTKLSDKMESIMELLKTINGIQTDFNGKKLMISGNTSSTRDYSLISRLAKEYKFIKTRVKLVSQGSIIDKLTTKLINLGAYDISIEKAGNIYFISACTRTENESKNIKLYLNSVLKHFKADINVVPYQIDIDVKIIETTRNEAKTYGLDLPKQLTLSSHSVLSSVELEGILFFSQQKGTTKVLYNPSLSANDGETADFHAGGSIPIKLTSQFSSNLVWKDYGVLLKFTPKVIRDRMINLDISSEFSSLAGTTEDNNIPSIVTRHVNTSVTVEDGKAIIISGLIQKATEHSVSGLPLLSDIPIISSIFSKNTDSNTKTELLIVVIPRLRLNYDIRFINQELNQLLYESNNK